VTESPCSNSKARYKRGVGLIITGGCQCVCQGPFMMRAYMRDNDSFIPSLAKIPRVVHEFRFGLQGDAAVDHAGRQVLKARKTHPN